jgi:hypothetical protein
VRDRLDASGTVYEYLDGSTRDRQARVERFQNDPDCGLFLISLKAGGLGLNLTARGVCVPAGPWWNPAVEAQAVDRAHRIGQTRQVFAYRLIARDTVEEKVLELQKTKKDLAAAIIGADNSLIKNLGSEDLELLLSCRSTRSGVTTRGLRGRRAIAQPKNRGAATTGDRDGGTVNPRQCGAGRLWRGMARYADRPSVSGTMA